MREGCGEGERVVIELGGGGCGRRRREGVSRRGAKKKGRGRFCGVPFVCDSMTSVAFCFRSDGG